ncbi:MAG: hypothetical protein ACTSVY_08650 [Candidatus Helarchaeota archaeon]
MKLNLTNIKDELQGDWWHHVDLAQFYFTYKIEDQENLEVKEGDILIHKEIKEGERFPTIRFHVVEDKNKIRNIERQELYELLTGRLIEYIEKKRKLPPNCKLTRVFKNGNIQIEYTPTKFDRFIMKFNPKKVGNEQAQEFLNNLIKEVLKEPKEWPIPSSSKKDTYYKVKVNANGKWHYIYISFIVLPSFF